MEEFIHVELKFLRLEKYLKNKDEDEDDLKNWETDPKEEEDTIWKIRSEKRKFKEEEQRFGVENAEWSELENIDPNNTTDLNKGVKNAELENMENWKTRNSSIINSSSTWIIFVCQL